MRSVGRKRTIRNRNYTILGVKADNMQRTIYNCGLIQKKIKAGFAKPEQWYWLEKCEGYEGEKNTEELCEQCKKCKYCIGRG